jgi:uncharacterized protein YfkK (UPF0435 family)
LKKLSYSIEKESNLINRNVCDDETLDKDKINQITIVYDSQDGNKEILD